MNQIAAAAMLFGVVTAVFAPLVADSAHQLFSRSASVSDAMDSAAARTGQAVASTGTERLEDGSSRVYLSGIGVSGIAVDAVMVDGIPRPYNLNGQDAGAVRIIEPGGLYIMTVNGTGDAIQVVAASGRLFEFALDP